MELQRKEYGQREEGSIHVFHWVSGLVSTKQQGHITALFVRNNNV